MHQSWGDVRNRALLVICGALFAIPAVVLAGWLFDMPFLRSVVPGLTAMNPLTAVCFILVGFSVWLLRDEPPPHLSKLLALGATVILLSIAVIRLAGYFGGTEIGLDSLLFPAKLDAEVVPNRMAPNTAICFLILGIGLLTARFKASRGRRGSHKAALIVWILTLNTLAGYLYGVGSLQKFSYIPMALNTAVLFALAAGALVALRPDDRLLSGFESRYAGGVMARRMLVATISVPLVVGWLCLHGERRGMYGNEFTLGLFAVCIILTMTVIVWLSAQALDRSDVLRRQSEAQLRLSEQEAQAAKDEAEQANIAKSAFLSRMSHELRTPLNSVLGFGQLLEMQDLSSQHREYVQFILRGGRHLLDLINEVLDISRIEAGKFALSPETVSVKTAVEDAVSLVSPMADHRSITVTADIDSGIFVRADKQRLTQVLLNLLSNAIKYNFEAGSVQISCTAEENRLIRIEVADTGPGIAQSDMESLFKPFERLGSANGVEGTGLGLALSKRLADVMGGSLSATRRAEGGMLFELLLPQADAPALPATPAARAKQVISPPVSGKTILHIEDNLANSELIEQLLIGRRDVKVISAMQGSIGLELAVEHAPDLILLDLHLPDMHGKDVLQALKFDPKLRSIPVVIISADATPGQAERLVEAGAHAFFTKPVALEEFFDVIHNLITNELSA